MKPQPALKYGLIVGVIAMAVSYFFGIQVTEADRLQLDTLIGAVLFVAPLAQALIQGWLTKRKVVPVKTLEKANISPEQVNMQAGFNP